MTELEKNESSTDGAKSTALNYMEAETPTMTLKSSDNCSEDPGSGDQDRGNTKDGMHDSEKSSKGTGKEQQGDGGEQTQFLSKKARRELEQGFNLTEEGPNHHRYDELSKSVLDLDKQSAFRRNNSPGYVRHRIIVATCFIFSASIVALSALDLKPLIERIGYLDKSGHVTYEKARPELPANISFAAEDAGEGLFGIAESTWGGEKYGFADESGKIVIEPKFADVSAFSDGLAAAKPLGKEEKNGFIDKKGNWRIPAQYDIAGAFKNGIGSASIGSDQFVLDRNGKVLESSKSRTAPSPAGNGLVVEKNGKYGFVTLAKGGFVIKPEYDSIRPLNFDEPQYFYRQELFSDTGIDNDKMLLLCKDVKYGLADADGKIIFGAQYDDIKSYNRGYAVFEKSKAFRGDEYDTHGKRLDGDKYGILKPDGTTLLEAKYDSITPYDDLMAVTNNGALSFINSNGTPIKTPKVESIVADSRGDWLKDGLGAVVIDNKFYFLNTKGQLAFPRGFVFATPFQEGYAAVWDGSWWRYINTRGELVFHKKFAKLELFKNGKAKVSSPGPLFGFTHPTAARGTNNNIKSTYTHEKQQND